LDFVAIATITLILNRYYVISHPFTKFPSI
jgi:hypothetical protein